MPETRHYDLIVIGSGPGGYVGAVRAAQLGMKVACIERDALGGVCLNWGCIPTKALLHNAELYREAIVHGAEWGIHASNVSVDWDRVIARSRGVTDQLSKGVAFLFKKNKIDHIQGHATITAGRTAGHPCFVRVGPATGDYYHGTGGADEDELLTADRVLLATGAAPRELPGVPFDGETIISSYEALALPRRPERMVIVGSGAIGMEFAYFFNCFGTEVTVVEMLDRVLPVEDADISRLAHRAFKKQGVTLHTSTTIRAVVKTNGGALVTLVNVNDEHQTQQIEVDVVLVAIGVAARYDGLFDDALGVDMERGFIRTDARAAPEPTYETSVPGVHAVGDVIGPPWLAHVASEEAVTAVERIAGHKTPGVNYDAIPGCTYCNPQVASIGLTEREAKERGIQFTTSKYQLKPHGKAVAVGANDGLIKLLADPDTGRILGGHIIGKDASELIGEVGLAIQLNATVADIIATMHAHPTMHEALHEAALGFEGRLIHG